MDNFDDMDNNGIAVIPEEMKHLKACMRCGLIKNYTQFLDNGCENCDFIPLKGNEMIIDRCTSSYYEGSIALLEPSTSWVAKWNGIADCVPGFYAIKVVGRMPEEYIATCVELGITSRATVK